VIGGIVWAVSEDGLNDPAYDAPRPEQGMTIAHKYKSGIVYVSQSHHEALVVSRYMAGGGIAVLVAVCALAGAVDAQKRQPSSDR
jgi:hypothetical protein